MPRRRSLTPWFVLVVVAVVVTVTGLYLRSHNVPLLEPKGVIGQEELSLMIVATALMLIVVVPVYILLFTIAYRYRETNHKAKYQPDFDHDRRIEFAWWAIPCLIIGVLAVVTWQSSHELDPYRAITSSTPPLTVQVVALQWKWLFIYPKENIASVNLLELPVGTPVNFQVTSDAPMNSFWIPQLGGQIYAMPGMATQLHLEAQAAGDYYGESANISGAGFAGMHFTARAVSQSDFNSWESQVKTNDPSLSIAGYNQLAKPSLMSKPTYFSSVVPALYDEVVMKYMSPNQSGTSGATLSDQPGLPQ